MLVILPVGHQVIGLVTNDPQVRDLAVAILPPVLLNTLASTVVSVCTGGILTSQGRPKLVTLLSMGFELPVTVGSVALMVLVFDATLGQVCWVQAAVSAVEAVVVLIIVSRSDWACYAREARQRQQAARGAAEEDLHMSLQPVTEGDEEREKTGEA